MKTIGRILYFIIGALFICRPIFDEQIVLLSDKIISILVGCVIIYSAINENKLFRSEEFMNENEKCILSVWKRIFIVIVDFIFVIGLTLGILKVINLSKDTTLVLIFSIILYYTFFETIFNSTIGKILFGAKVFHIGQDISSLNFIKAFKRSLLRLNPFNVFFLFSSKPIFYHDLFTDTITLSKSKFMKDFSKEDTTDELILENAEGVKKQTTIDKSTISDSNATKKVIKTPPVDVANELMKLKELLDLGIITQDEYDKKATQLKKLLLDS